MRRLKTGDARVMLYKSAGLLVLTAVAALAQDVISAKSGLIHYTEGVVRLDGSEVQRKNAEFPSMKVGGELRTGTGRAEVLLSPGVFVRVPEDSAFRMVRNDLLDTKLELTAGTILVEVGDVEKNQSLSVSVGEANVDLSKRGLFQIAFRPAELRVIDGSAVVQNNGQSLTVKEGRLTALNGVLSLEKFDKEEGNAFLRWASRRSGYIAAANLTSAKREYDNGSSMAYSSWAYNPYFGMFTYIPNRGMYHNPFGYSFYSPNAISGVYYRPSYPTNSYGGWNGPTIGESARGMGDMGGRGSYGGYSGGGGGMSAPAASSGPAAPAAGGRGASDGGGRSAGAGR
ncbi:MAG: FecR domain-containing protein [Bryobacteraceae bacterium]|nr:FecR domain-containing protein [Bryobacteraceae bacterium]